MDKQSQKNMFHHQLPFNNRQKSLQIWLAVA